jgi:hypothetical protein
LEVDKYGIFITVCQRNINTNANETGGVISGEQPRKYFNKLMLWHLLFLSQDYPHSQDPSWSNDF